MGGRGVCDRCGTLAELYEITDVDEDTGERRNGRVCWDCDWDITNSQGSLTDDVGEVLMRRAEEDYEYDPLYYPCPPWMAEAR